MLSCHHPYSTEKEDGERLSSTEEELARTQDVAEAPPRVLVDASVLPGGFGGSPNHDPHILYTTSAVQLLAIYDALDRVDADAVAAQIASLQLRDGSFQGDCWGEVDTRFSYCAILTLSILKRLHFIDTEKAANYILRSVFCRGTVWQRLANSAFFFTFTYYVRILWVDPDSVKECTTRTPTLGPKPSGKFVL